jgi:hypothetical protein
MTRVNPETGEVTLTWRDRRTLVLNRAAYICEVCKDSTATEVDHIWPRSWGGTDDLDNLQASCVPCNRSKGGTPFIRDITPGRADWTASHNAKLAYSRIVTAAMWEHVSTLTFDLEDASDYPKAYEQAVAARDGMTTEHLSHIARTMELLAMALGVTGVLRDRLQAAADYEAGGVA